MRELRYYLDMSSDIEAGPSIGPKTAEHFYGIGIRTVRELLAADPDETASKIENRRISANTVRQWQQQAALVCQVPELRGHDAQLLVACDVSEAAELANQDADRLFAKIDKFVETKAGMRVLRNGSRPTADEVRQWVRYAKQYRQLRAA